MTPLSAPLELVQFANLQEGLRVLLLNHMNKQLGKIQQIKFGRGGYQDAKASWYPNMIKHSEHCKWTEEGRNLQFVDIVKYISDLLAAAKKTSVNKLVGVPIEAEFEAGVLKSWRILEEVL